MNYLVRRNTSNMVIRQSIRSGMFTDTESGQVCLIFEKFFPGKVLYLRVLKQRTEADAQRCFSKRCA